MLCRGIRTSILLVLLRQLLPHKVFQHITITDYVNLGVRESLEVPIRINITGVIVR